MRIFVVVLTSVVAFELTADAEASEAETCFFPGQYVGQSPLVALGKKIGDTDNLKHAVYEWPNGGFTADINHCQQTCHTLRWWCQSFTYLTAKQGSMGTGACWLFNANTTLDKGDSSTKFMSGPVGCLGDDVSPPLIMVTAPPLPVLYPLASTTALRGADSKVDLTADSRDAAGATGGLPWWGILLGAVGFGGAALLGYCLLGDKSGAASSKKKGKSSPTRAVHGSSYTSVAAEPSCASEASRDDIPLMVESSDTFRQSNVAHSAAPSTSSASFVVRQAAPMLVQTQAAPVVYVGQSPVYR